MRDNNSYGHIADAHNGLNDDADNKYQPIGDENNYQPNTYDTDIVYHPNERPGSKRKKKTGSENKYRDGNFYF